MGAITVLAGSLLFGLLLIMLNERQMKQSVSQPSSLLRTKEESKFSDADYSWPLESERKMREKFQEEVFEDYKRIRKEVASLRLMLLLLVLAIGVVLYYAIGM
ncbi:MAG: hypothetical protein AAF798_02820 [Bacteroidota bacterium]